MTGYKEGDDKEEWYAWWQEKGFHSISYVAIINSLSPCFPYYLELFLPWECIQLEQPEWCSARWTNSLSLLHLQQADLRLIFPSARWILAQLPPVSIYSEVKSLRDLGLNTCCLATAQSDPPKLHLVTRWRQLNVGCGGGWRWAGPA